MYADRHFSPFEGGRGDVNNQSYKNLNYINKPF